MKKRKQTLWQWLTTNFIVHIRNEENFALKRDFTINYAQILAVLVFGFILTAIVNFYIFKVINDYYSGERRLEAKYNRQIINLALRLDSLEYEISRKDSFIADVKKIVAGNTISRFNVSTGTSANLTKSNAPSGQASDQELKLREEFERNQLKNNALSVRVNKTIADLSFFPPVTNGVITSNYNTVAGHYGLDVVAKPNEPIKSTLEGTVIFAGWTKETGNTIVIQHKRDLLSVYKHNASLLKKTGNQVVAGEVIAIIGNSGELSSGPHLHFEIWHKGLALNPKDYIVF